MKIIEIKMNCAEEIEINKINNWKTKKPIIKLI